jgi:predicted acyl esterase
MSRQVVKPASSVTRALRAPQSAACDGVVLSRTSSQWTSSLSMTMRVSLGLGATLLAWGTCALAQAYEIAFREASIPMPDGVKLADLYLPQGDGRRKAAAGV